MGKELLMKVLNHEDTNGQIPWIPFAGVHAGKLKGYSGREVLTDSAKLIESLREVYKLYQPDGMPITFDLQLEAEILGCELMWADYNPLCCVSSVRQRKRDSLQMQIPDTGIWTDTRCLGSNARNERRNWQ